MQVPRIHCLVHRKLAIHDFLSSSPTLEVSEYGKKYLLSQFVTVRSSKLAFVNLQPKPNFVKGVREALLGHLTSVLGDDGLAAHFILLHLLSSVRCFLSNLYYDSAHICCQPATRGKAFLM